MDFNPKFTPSISSSFVKKTIYKTNKKYNLNIWDKAGQEEYKSCTKLFIKNIKILIFVYAIDNKESFESLKSYWVVSTKEILGDEATFGLFGNKSDLYK